MRRAALLPALWVFLAAARPAAAQTVLQSGAAVSAVSGIGAVGAAMGPAGISGLGAPQLGSLTPSLGGTLPALQPPSRAAAAGLSLPHAAPAASPAYAYKPIPARDPDTGIYGVSAEQSKVIVDVLRKHYGDDMLDLAVVGSRARGTASALKSFRPVHEKSDLDLVPLVKDLRGKGPSVFDIAKELKEKLGISVEVHSVISFDGQRFRDSVPFYGGGDESWLYFASGEAVRIPLEKPAEKP